MRKLLKILFSQSVIISFLIILQLGLITASVLRLSRYFLYAEHALGIISLAVVVLIVNRHSNPMYKLAWVVPILIFPLFGGLFYLFIMGQTHTKVFFKKLKNLEKHTTKDYPQKNDIVMEIEKTHPERVSTVRYIENATGLSVYRLRSARYFSVGEEKWKELLSDLSNAKRYIFLEYFIINKGQMWESILEILRKKAAEGVDVRIMYDGMGSIALPSKYNKELEKYGIKCRVFSPFTPFLSSLQNNRDHRKIAVIDGEIAYTGGINLSDEYINVGYPYGHWKDMGVKICGEAAFSFAIMFLQLWHINDSELPDIKSFEPSFSEEGNSHEGFVMPYHDIPQDDYQTGEYIYLDIINKAKKYIYITTPYLILDHEMVVALINAARGGVDVKIICPAVADHWYARAVAYSFYKELTENGVHLYEYTPGFIHGKTFVSDDEVCVVGSINLDYRSLYLHFECAAWFLDSPIVSMVKGDFDNTIKSCRPITIEDCNKISTWRKIRNALLRIFAPLM